MCGKVKSSTDAAQEKGKRQEYVKRGVEEEGELEKER